MPRLTVDLPDEINARLTSIAKKEGITKAEAMRKAFALFAVAIQEKEKGNSLSIVRENPDNNDVEILAKVVGL